MDKPKAVGLLSLRQLAPGAYKIDPWKIGAEINYLDAK